MNPNTTCLIQKYFDQSAAGYWTEIAGVFQVAVADFSSWSEPFPPGPILDIGAGTGLVAQKVNQHNESPMVISLDISARMLRYARLAGLTLLTQANFHDLPFSDNSFDRIYASFALNSADPHLALAEALRVLRPKGQIFVQEWGHTDQLSETISDIMSEFAVNDPPPELEKLRADCSQPIPWDQLETFDDLSDIFSDVGFGEIHMQTVELPVLFSRVQDFINFKFAWPLRQAEFEAMSEDIKILLLADLRENLGQYTNADGNLIWNPELVRLRATKS